jgi:multiple sugar transport system permease protein
MRLSAKNREARNFYLFIMPWLLGAIVFTCYPIMASLYYSFTEYDIIHPAKWVGFENYFKMLQDELFWRGVKATLIFTVFSVPLQLLLALILALLVNQKIPFRGLFRTLLYFPSMVSGVTLSLVWLWVFNSKSGIFNYLLSLIVWKVPAGCRMSNGRLRP